MTMANDVINSYLNSRRTFQSQQKCLFLNPVLFQIDIEKDCLGLSILVS